MNRRGFMARISAVLGALAVGPRVLEAADPLEFTGLQGVDWGSGRESIALVEWEKGRIVRVERLEPLTATEIQRRQVEMLKEQQRLLGEFHDRVVQANLSRLEAIMRRRGLLP